MKPFQTWSMKNTIWGKFKQIWLCSLQVMSDLVCDQGVMLRDSVKRLLFASALIEPEYCVDPKYLKGHLITQEWLHKKVHSVYWHTFCNTVVSLRVLPVYTTCILHIEGDSFFCCLFHVILEVRTETNSQFKNPVLCTSKQQSIVPICFKSFYQFLWRTNIFLNRCELFGL